MDIKSLPHDESAEAAVLGSVFVDNTCFDTAYEILRQPSYFYTTMNARLWEIMHKMINEGKPIDYITLIDRLDENDKLLGITPY